MPSGGDGAGERRNRLAFVGDVHLERDDPDLPDFLAFLDTLGRTSRRIVLMGDLFDLWIGQPELEQSHHVAVATKLAELRRQGLRVCYLEGNRDYRIGESQTGRAFDESSEAGRVEEFGGRRIYAIHGDLVNPDDRQYRRWRRISRSGLAWALFNALPRATRLRWSSRAEFRMRATNLEFKFEFPEEAVRSYAAGLFRKGYDAVVLGHFHIEKDLLARGSDPRGRIIVLPEWKGSRRHLEVLPDGQIGFVDSMG